MKNLLIICLVGVMMTLVSSCADETKQPIITFDQATKGAYVKLLSETPPVLDLANLGSASYSYDVEFVDFEQGDLVSVYELFVSYVDNNPDNGDNSQGNTLWKSVSASEFGSSDRGFKSTSVAVTLTELLTLFGLSSDDLLPNDQFVFDTNIILQDGSLYGAENSSAAVNGSAFAGHFDYALTATCPLSDNLFVGDYELSYVEGPGNPWATGVRVGTVTLQLNGNPTKRDINVIVIDAFGGFDMTAELEFVCDVVQWNSVTPGVGCGNDILYNNNGTMPQDITNDSEIIVGYFEDGGDCGYTNEDVIKLTKL